jgi:histone acetyltransferase 1
MQQIEYTSGSLCPFVEMSYSEKYVPASSSSNENPIHADETLKMLEEYLPKDYLSDYDSFVDAVETDHERFKPMGDKIQEYTRENRDGSVEHFEIYKVKFASIYELRKLIVLDIYRTRFQM